MVSSVAAAILDRDVTNLANFFGTYAPELLGTQFGKEIWSLYQAGRLTPNTPLTGLVAAPTGRPNVDGVILEIELARQEEEERRRRQMEMREMRA